MTNVVLLHASELVGVMLQRALRMSGWNVTVQRSTDVSQVGQQVRDGLAACVAVASQLPSGDGLELVHGFAADCRAKKIPLLIIGAETSLPRRAAAVAAGATAWLTKPIDPQALREALANFSSPLVGEG